MDSVLSHIPQLKSKDAYLPYVGNGFIGSAIFEEAKISIKSAVNWNNILNMNKLYLFNNNANKKIYIFCSE